MLTHYSKKPLVYPSLKRCESNRGDTLPIKLYFDLSHVRLAVGIIGFIADCVKVLKLRELDKELN